MVPTASWEKGVCLFGVDIMKCVYYGKCSHMSLIDFSLAARKRGCHIYNFNLSFYYNIFYFFYFISFIGHRNSRLQGERPMGLVQTGKRDPCKAQPLNKSMTIDNKKKKNEKRSIYSKYIHNAV